MGNLRPTRFDEIIGQQDIIERLKISIDCSKKINEPLPHVLLSGPPGLGKTTIALATANELGTKLIECNAAGMTGPRDVLPYLMNANRNPGSVLFIDEIHRLSNKTEEFLYPVIEDFKLSIVLKQGVKGKVKDIPLRPFTIIGATTNDGELSPPLYDRFPIKETLKLYSEDELAQLVAGNAVKLNLNLDKFAAMLIARRSRGTPRIANARLSWVRSYCISRRVSPSEATIKSALDMSGVDEQGLEERDRDYMRVLGLKFQGGPAGIKTLSAATGIDSDTLMYNVEPYLIRQGLINRASRGRKLTDDGKRYVERLSS